MQEDLEKKLFYDYDELKKEGDKAFKDGIIAASIGWTIVVSTFVIFTYFLFSN